MGARRIETTYAGHDQLSREQRFLECHDVGDHLRRCRRTLLTTGHVACRLIHKTRMLIGSDTVSPVPVHGRTSDAEVYGRHRTAPVYESVQTRVTVRVLDRDELP